MTRLPSLGPRGEGWVLIQLLLLGALATVSAVVGVGLIIARRPQMQSHPAAARA